MMMGKRELRQMETAVLRLAGQAWGGGRAVLDQSSEPISAPISPPLEKISLGGAAGWRATFPAALLSRPAKIWFSCPDAQSYHALADRLLTRRNCFVVLGYEKVELGHGENQESGDRSREAEERSQKSEVRRQKAKGGRREA